MSEFPILDYLDREAAIRAEDGMERAAGRAERIEPGWKAAALDAVRVYALSHERFALQDIALLVPPEADRRATGPLSKEAARRGWIAHDGFARDKWGSWKSYWRSLIYGGAS